MINITTVQIQNDDSTAFKVRHNEGTGNYYITIENWAEGNVFSLVLNLEQLEILHNTITIALNERGTL